MNLQQVHLRKPCYDFSLYAGSPTESVGATEGDTIPTEQEATTHKQGTCKADFTLLRFYAGLLLLANDDNRLFHGTGSSSEARQVSSGATADRWQFIPREGATGANAVRGPLCRETNFYRPFLASSVLAIGGAATSGECHQYTANTRPEVQMRSS